MSCFFGNVCQQNWYTKSHGIKRCEEILPAVFEEIYWRAAKKQLNREEVTTDSLTVCAHHEIMFTKKYSGKFPNCIDPFNNHEKKDVVGRKLISLDEAKKIVAFYPEENVYIPGRKMCSRCYKTVEDYCSQAVVNNNCDDDDDVDYDNSMSIENNLNASLELIGESPLKVPVTFHAVPSRV